MTLTEELILAALVATEDRKQNALRMLRGEEKEPVVRQTTGPVLLGMGAAAQYLGVSRATLWRVLRAGKIEKVELFHGSFRVRRQDLEDLAAGKFGMSGYGSGRRGRKPKQKVL